jgi:hypothetical protein
MTTENENPTFYWALVPPIQDGAEDEVAAHAARLNELVPKVEDAGEEVPEALLDEINGLLAAIEEKSTDKCQLAVAPRMGDRGDAEQVARHVFDTEEYEKEGYDFPTFLKEFKTAADCDKCAMAQEAYGHEVLDPCEITPRHLEEVVRDPDVLEKVQFEMDPVDMAELAQDLQRLLDGDQIVSHPDLDARAYVTTMIAFLKKWSDQECRLVPAFLDDDDDSDHDSDHDCGCGCK